jgi:hypothetical protein
MNKVDRRRLNPSMIICRLPNEWLSLGLACGYVEVNVSAPINVLENILLKIITAGDSWDHLRFLILH